MSRLIKVFVGLIFAVIVVVAVFGILPQLGLTSPFANIFEAGKTSAVSAALDLSGLKEKISSALQNNRDRIASATGLTSSQVDTALQALAVDDWQVTNLPDNASPTQTVNVTYQGTDATITTYDDPSIVSVTTYGQTVTLAVPQSAQSYLPYLAYLQ